MGQAHRRVVALVVSGLGACHAHATSTPDAAEDAAQEIAVVDARVDDVDARGSATAAARALLDAGAYEGPRIGAMSMQTSVVSAPEWPESDGGLPSTRLGYLRHGAKVPVIPEPIVNDACPEGWFELVQGGFVCGKYATLDLKHPRVRLAPSPPNTSAALPYRYGYNLANGTPLYRRVLSVDDRKKHEPWLEPKPTPVEDAGIEGEGQADEEASDVAAGAPRTRGNALAPPLAAALDASTPWFLRTYDGGRPKITLDELHGRGVLVRRMVRGFYLALDREFKAAHARWWRTTAGFAVPFDRVALQPPLGEFHGAWLTPEGGAADGGRQPVLGNGAVAFITSSSARKYLVDTETQKVAWAEAVPRRTAIALTGTSGTVGGATYELTTDGAWILRGDALLAVPSAPPADLAPGEKWIDVDLTRQILIAFEGEKPVFATLVSSGKRNPTDKEKDHPTPVGTYRIREKHLTANMDGDVAADGPYSIEDVPWVMYFQGSYALHGAFWHSQFGRTMSHGCVNLSPGDARTLFQWTLPRLPEGWHGVFAPADRPGTRVVVHEDTK